MTENSPSPYGLELVVRPGSTPPARYAVDEVTEQDFTISTGMCRVCATPRTAHEWVLFDGDTPVDCSQRAAADYAV
jgi:hypothetical protein